MVNERDKKVIETTFNTTPKNINSPWGWRIPKNPERKIRKPQESEYWELLTEEELEVDRIVENKIIQEREVWRTKTYVYSAPFNYPNVKVELGRPGTGVEYNGDGVELDIYPYGAIIIEETEPIVSVTVIGSGCSNQAYVVLEAEPLVWKYPRTGVRMRKDHLWGMHLRWDAWVAVGEDWNDAGLSCSRFDIPESKKIIVGGGGHGSDPHYCIRTIRLEIIDS